MNSLNGRRVGALAGLALAGVMALAACATNASGGGAYGAGGGSTTTAGSSGGSSSAVNLNCASGATVCTKTVMVKGQSKTVLATTGGMTLYYFTPDTATAIACSGSCAQQWPPLTATGGSVTGTNLSGALSTVNGANGVQVIYNGHPLYTYGDDKAQTDANGEGEFGKWFVATPDLAAASGAGAAGGATATPSSSGTGGYGGY